jgi:hypothetical protein
LTFHYAGRTTDDRGYFRSGARSALGVQGRACARVVPGVASWARGRRELARLRSVGPGLGAGAASRACAAARLQGAASRQRARERREREGEREHGGGGLKMSRERVRG